MADLSNVRVNGARLWDSLMEMAKIGATPKGGCKRLTLTDLDREGRELFRRWCEAEGCAVKVDGMGNMFAQARPARTKRWRRSWWGAIWTRSRPGASSTGCSAS